MSGRARRNDGRSPFRAPSLLSVCPAVERLERYQTRVRQPLFAGGIWSRSCKRRNAACHSCPMPPPAKNRYFQTIQKDSFYRCFPWNFGDFLGHFSGQMAARASRTHENGHFVLLRILIRGRQNTRFLAILEHFLFLGERHYASKSHGCHRHFRRHSN